MYWKCSSREVRKVSSRERRKAELGMEVELGWTVEVVAGSVLGVGLDIVEATGEFRGSWQRCVSVAKSEYSLHRSL